MDREKKERVGMTEATPTVWHIGQVILEQYEVTDILGEGGMGTVYKVHHRGWDIDLAVKSPRPEMFARAGGQENKKTCRTPSEHAHAVDTHFDT